MERFIIQQRPLDEVGGSGNLRFAYNLLRNDWIHIYDLNVGLEDIHMHHKDLKRLLTRLRERQIVCEAQAKEASRMFVTGVKFCRQM